MRPIIKNQEQLNEKDTIQENEAQQEPDTEEWAKSNLSWLSQSEYRRYLDLLEEQNLIKDLDSTGD
ncbi:hypothetical protein GCM10011450_03870 [Advenella faeciporci]|jgi:phage terminase small subunit|uniref:Uncharacterized protein n=2 Tax=Advenella TaxID=290425 RepID=A0A918MWW1_9BURK|nr:MULTISPECIES: hypothetical protein [Advenella]NLN67312.1 hypothetical protein [Alcaligenaceae bacterium]MBV4397197.1 hypothetical protein [Advenella alkanexedens]MDD3757724.1 hypothetical protein [Advenella sp.]NLY34698.1 hypothetical protein [Alcaligenaceae bacterium]GGW77397.1 hypothetical protein GCM10011450_03870 [Advenella faeciporci]